MPVLPSQETSMATPSGTADPAIDPAGLFMEEIFTDRRVGTIRRMTPVKSDGARDAGRPVVYVGEMQLMTPMGSLPIAFEIEAATLDEAVGKFGPLAKSAMDEAARELQELRRQASSQIVVPGQGPAGKILR
jgi:hypothetical protein